MRKTYALLICVAALVGAADPVFHVLDCGQLAVFGRELSCGAYVEEIVPADHPGRELVRASHADVVFGTAETAGPAYVRELYVNGYADEHGHTVRIGIDLLAYQENRRINRERADLMLRATAQIDNGEVPDVEPAVSVPPQQGFLARTGSTIQEQFREHPVRSTLVTVAGILLADYWSGGGINGFGYLGADGGGGSQVDAESANSTTRGSDSPSVVISGDNNNVTITQDRSIAPAPVIFPPQ